MNKYLVRFLIGAICLVIAFLTVVFLIVGVGDVDEGVLIESKSTEISDSTVYPVQFKYIKQCFPLESDDELIWFGAEKHFNNILHLYLGFPFSSDIDVPVTQIGFVEYVFEADIDLSDYPTTRVGMYFVTDDMVIVQDFHNTFLDTLSEPYQTYYRWMWLDGYIYLCNIINSESYGEVCYTFKVFFDSRFSSPSFTPESPVNFEIYQIDQGAVPIQEQPIGY